MKTVDVESGADLPAGEKGELCIKSVLIMREYWNKPDATKKVRKTVQKKKTGAQMVTQTDPLVLILHFLVVLS